MSDLRHLSALTVEVTFEGNPPDLTGVPGVRAVVVEGNRLRCQVIGPVDPLLKALAGSTVRELLSREPSLEELFLAHYGADAAEAQTAVADGTH